MLDEETIQELITITKTIKNIYDNLAYADYIQNKHLYQEYLEYLKMATQLEDKIYSKIVIPIEKEGIIGDRINYFIIKEELGDYPKMRILGYLANREYQNPYLSMQNISVLKYEENAKAISAQYEKDYVLNLLKKLEEYLQQEEKETIKEDFIREKYHIIMSYKELEYEILGIRKRTGVLNGRKRLILFGHDEDMISEIYYDNTFYLVKDAYGILEQMPTLEEIRFPEKREYILRNLQIESSLELLPEEESQELLGSINKNKDLEEINKRHLTLNL